MPLFKYPPSPTRPIPSAISGYNYVEFITSSGDKVCATVSGPPGEENIIIKEMIGENTPGTKSIVPGEILLLGGKQFIVTESGIVPINDPNDIISDSNSHYIPSELHRSIGSDPPEDSFDLCEKITENFLENVLREVCLEKTLTHVPLQDELENNGLESWEPSSLFVTNSVSPNMVKSYVENVLKDKGYRSSALSWIRGERDSGKDGYSLMIKMI